MTETEGIARPGALVSIVTPTLNQSGFLMQTIASVRNQTYPFVEHIIVDGGSTDGTLGLLHELDDDPRVSWTSGPDDSMYHAINDGLSRTRGEIVTYLNSDDLLLPWAIERVVRAFERDPSIGLIYGDALRYFQEIDRFDLILQPRFRLGTLGRTGSFVQPAVFWRRGVVDTVGSFDTTYRLSADLDFWLRASRLVSFGQVDEVLAIERAHPAAQTARLRVLLGSEARAIRGRFHPDGLLRLPLKLAARFADGLAARMRLVRFARTVGTTDPAWSEVRATCRPRIQRFWFSLAMITPRPLVGTPTRSVVMRLFRRRWLDIDADALWRAVDGDGPNAVSTEP